MRKRDGIVVMMMVITCYYYDKDGGRQLFKERMVVVELVID